MNKIAHLLDVIDNVRDHMALGLMSDPGLSKTAQVKQWADEHSRRYCELIISQRMPSEISGMPMPVQGENGKPGTMEVFDFSTLLELEDGDVLAFDEFTNGNIQTLNACLTLIQERTMLSGKKLPSLVVTAMGNPQGRCEILPQTKQRFWWVTVNWHADTWVKYMRKTWNVEPDKRVLAAITDQYKQGFSSATDWNFWTPRTMENMFRVAKTIHRDDPWWQASGVASHMVHSIYSSFKEDDTFTKVKQRIHGWVAEQINTVETKEEDAALLAFAEAIDRCQTSQQLKEYLNEADTPNPHETPEFNAVVSEFLVWLNTVKVDELDHDIVTAATPRSSKLMDIPIWDPKKHGSGRAW